MKISLARLSNQGKVFCTNFVLIQTKYQHELALLYLLLEINQNQNVRMKIIIFELYNSKFWKECSDLGHCIVGNTDEDEMNRRYECSAASSIRFMTGHCLDIIPYQQRPGVTAIAFNLGHLLCS